MSGTPGEAAAPAGRASDGDAMSKEKKSMDDVLASIRRIIRTDPTATPPDLSSPGGATTFGDQTARDVLDKLRREREGGRDVTGKPLSTSDDPEEAAHAVLDHLRKEAEARLSRQKAAEAEKAAPAAPEKAEPPKVEKPLEEPPEVAADEEDVPVTEERAEPAPAAEARGPAEPLELGKDAGRRVMRPHSAPPPDPELPQPGGPAHARGEPAIMIDEAALEAMIRRVVRDELMGEMGRRITRNVVKLVRDEVARSRIERK